MKEHNSPELYLDLFLRLRQKGIRLGISELLAAIQASQQSYDWEKSDEGTRVKWLAQRIWCHSVEEESEFQSIWNEVYAQFETETGAVSSGSPPYAGRTAPEQSAKVVETKLPDSDQEEITPPDVYPAIAPLISLSDGDLKELNEYWPISRRAMTYAWRYLRRPVLDGFPEILDVYRTVEQSARQGFYLEPFYKRRERNHARLTFFIDQDGSMVPFHRYSRHLIETASTGSTIGQVDVYYFHNVPGKYVYLDPHLTISIPLERALAQCNNETSILIVSDAGSARHHRRPERIQETAHFLLQLRKRGSALAWLNPMPRERWDMTSAQIIAFLIPMYEMSSDDFSNAIDAIRAQEPTF